MQQSLYTHLCSFENLFLAYRKARRGKRGKAAVAAFEYHQEEELLRLQEELIAETWQPAPYHSFYIHDPKKRLISAAPFCDRVVHHALCNEIEPIWERLFISDTYANRAETPLGGKKGTHRALLRANQFARDHAYVLQCDIKQYFQSIDHQILRGMLARRIHDQALLGLVDRILHSGENIISEQYEMQWFAGDDLLAALRPRGLPIGNLTSQFWANVYLNDFDHFVKRELSCPAYVRYVDDFLLFADDKKTLHGWKNAIQGRMHRLRLTLHEPQVYPVNTGIPFLGFRIYPHYRLLKRRRGIAFQRRLRALFMGWAAGEIPRSRLDNAACSWAAHAAWGNTVGLRKALLGAYILNPITKTS